MRQMQTDTSDYGKAKLAQRPNTVTFIFQTERESNGLFGTYSTPLISMLGKMQNARRDSEKL